MKARESGRTKWYIGGAGLVALFAWYCLGLVAEPHTRPVSGYVTVYGLVAKEGKYTWRQDMTARKLIADAGGTPPFARTNKVKVLDANVPAHVQLWRKSLGWVATVVNRANDHVDSAWDSWGLVGISPDFRMQVLPPDTKAILNLRRPASDAALLPGDVVIVEEILVNF